MMRNKKKQSTLIEGETRLFNLVPFVGKFSLGWKNGKFLRGENEVSGCLFDPTFSLKQRLAIQKQLEFNLHPTSKNKTCNIIGPAFFDQTRRHIQYVEDCVA